MDGDTKEGAEHGAHSSMFDYLRKLSAAFEAKNEFVTLDATASVEPKLKTQATTIKKRGTMMKTIAIIDDDIHIGDMLTEVLTQEGYAVLRAYSGTEALYLLSQNKPDLVLLDLMLPGLSGEEVLPHIENIPIIVLSAKVDVQDKVNLLLSGATDYMTKPFDTKELLARITVQLRKAEQHEDSTSLSVGDLSLDMLSLALTVQGQPVKLTRTEYAILKLLMANPKQVIAKSVLLDRISMDTPDCTERSLKQHISNLRKKMQDVSGVDYIETVWGIGFKLAEQKS